jgi:hypothetical protein
LVSGWVLAVVLAAVAVAGLGLLLVVGLRVRRAVHDLGAAMGTARQRLVEVSAARQQLAPRRPRGR